MAFTIVKTVGTTIILEARGTLTKGDYADVLDHISDLANKNGNVNLLIRAKNLDAISPGDEDEPHADFDPDFLNDVNRIAVVGPEETAKVVYAFFVVLITEERVRAFDDIDDTRAIAWLDARDDDRTIA